MPKTYDVEIVLHLPLDQLSWPSEAELADDTSLAGNQHYMDLRGLGWCDLANVLARESELIGLVESGRATEEELLEQLAQGCDGIDDPPLVDLDIGMASPVCAISAAGCIPAFSCNAGALGGTHLASYPIVAFYAGRRVAPLLLRCAHDAGVGLRVEGGVAVLYGTTLRSMLRFAEIVSECRDEFDVGAKGSDNKS